MAADVSSMVKSNGKSSEILITRDLLGQFSKVRNNKDLEFKDLQHLQISLDFKKEMVYPQRFKSSNSPLSSSLDKKEEKTIEKAPKLKFLEESSLELKLVPSSQCQTVCTLDKVKFALKRAQEEKTIIKKRCYSSSSSPPPPPLSPSLPSQECLGNEEDGDKIKRSSISSSSSGMFAAGCPGCLMYIMTLKTNPKCPRCNSTVPTPSSLKKPRIDLNS